MNIFIFLALLKRCLDKTNPSPPLFPLPHTIDILSIFSLIFLNIPKPAFSIRISPEIPSPSMACLSIFFTSSDLRYILSPHLLKYQLFPIKTRKKEHLFKSVLDKYYKLFYYLVFFSI